MANEEDPAPVPDMRLELVPMPVSDVDRAKAFSTLIGNTWVLHQVPW